MMVEKQTPLNTKEEYPQPREREISLEEILRIILRRRYGILAVLALSLFAALFVHYLQTPEYRAESVIMINETKAPGDLLEAVLGPNGAVDSKASRKDVELLKSMPIAEQTVRELYRSGRRDTLEFFGNKRYFSPLAGVIKPLLTLKFWQKKEKKSPDEVLRSDALRLNSRIRVDAVRETNLLKVTVASPFADEAAFLSNTLCRVYKDADISRNSEKYAQASRFITDMLREQQQKVVDADNAQSKYMAEHEIYEFSGNTQQLLDKLIETDAKYNGTLAEYNITSNNLGFLEKKLSEADRALGSRISENVNSQLGAIMDEIKGRESEYIQLLKEKGAENGDVRAKKQQLDVVKTRYEQLSRSKIAGQIGYAGRAQKYSFDLVSEKLQIQRRLNELRFSSLEYSRLKQYYENQLSTLPKKQQDYAKLLRDREVVNKTYVFLKEKLDETRILLGSEVGSVALIGSAFEPFKPEKPDLKKSLLMGLVLGGLLAALYTYGAELFDDTIKDESYFKEIGLATLAFIPLVMENGKHAFSGEGQSRISRLLYSKSRDFREKLLEYGASRGRKPYVPKKAEVPMPRITDSLSSSFSESFRTLRTALEYSRVDNPLHSILISGTAMSEGKSTVSANLGMSFALTGKKTLIIDCDLRRASMHKKFEVQREPGLTDYLFSQQHTIDESYFRPTHMENLFVMSAGKYLQNCNELLGTAKMQTLIKELEGKFDKVLIDSPPLFLSDAAQLARSVDGILLTARLQFTSRKPMQDFAVDHFLRPLMLGVVVIESNNQGLFGYGYGYGRYGYGKYGYRKYEEEA